MAKFFERCKKVFGKVNEEELIKVYLFKVNF